MVVLSNAPDTSPEVAENRQYCKLTLRNRARGKLKQHPRSNDQWRYIGKPTELSARLRRPLASSPNRLHRSGQAVNRFPLASH